VAQAAVTAARADEFVRKFLWNAYLKPRGKSIDWIVEGFTWYREEDINFPTLQVRHTPLLLQ
jgi:hypothetical protein